MEFNLQTVLGLLIGFIPVLLGLICAKRYNILHGIIVWFTTSFVVLFIVNALTGKMNPAMQEAAAGALAGTTLVHTSLVAMLKAKVAFFVDKDWAILVVYILVLLIFQIIASAIRRKKVEKRKDLERASKRY